jgi:L-histidine Nalpha-methyltransferase
MKTEDIVRAEFALDTREFARDVRTGLSSEQKQLHSQYLYDRVGSALFEVITLLPEYGLTRADERVLEQNAEQLPQFFEAPPLIAELGSGTGVKTRRILGAFDPTPRDPLDYVPIDISPAALARCESDIGQIDGVRVHALASSYIDGLQQAVRRARPDTPVLLLFLGSTIGNFERRAGRAFLEDVRRELRSGDVMCLGTDLVKPLPALLSAYDDPLGVTAAFNLNVLSRINRELGGNFDLSAFQHVVRYDEVHRRIEMHIESLQDTTVTIEAAEIEVPFSAGETIWTESSHKFTCAEVRDLARATGFSCAAQWVDEEWPFAESVLVAED